jgi:hypothetical protein
MIVLKFGGTSVEDADAMRNVGAGFTRGILFHCIGSDVLGV